MPETTQRLYTGAELGRRLGLSRSHMSELRRTHLRDAVCGDLIDGAHPVVIRYAVARGIDPARLSYPHHMPDDTPDRHRLLWHVGDDGLRVLDVDHPAMLAWLTNAVCDGDAELASRLREDLWTVVEQQRRAGHLGDLHGALEELGLLEV